MAIARFRSFIGIAKEATRSPGVAPTAVAATDFLPVKTITPFDNIKYLDDQNYRGSMVETYGTQAGPIYSDFEIGGDVFPDTIGYAVAGVLGDYAISGASAPYTHTISTLNSGTGQATSYTVSDYNGLNTRQYAGLQWSEVAFKFNADGLLEYTAKAMGYASATTTLPTPSYSTVVPMPSWEGTTTIAGSPSLNLQSGDLTIKRAVTPIFTVDNSAGPYQMWQGAVSAEGTLSLVFESDAQLDYYLNNTQPTLVLDFSQGAGATLTQIQFTLTKCAFTVAKIERSKDYVELSVNFKGIANTTDAGVSAGYSPVKVVLKNAKATTVYA